MDEQKKAEFVAAIQWYQAGFDVIMLMTNVAMALVREAARVVYDIIGLERFVGLYIVVMLLMFTSPKWVPVAEALLVLAVNVFLFVVAALLFYRLMGPNYFRFIWYVWFG